MPQEKILFWTLAIGSALILLAMLVQAWAVLNVMRRLRPTIESAKQLSEKTSQTISQSRLLFRELGPRTAALLNEVKLAAHGTEERVQYHKAEIENALKPLRRAPQKFRALLAGRSSHKEAP
jgi:hypothetical protein